MGAQEIAWPWLLATLLFLVLLGSGRTLRTLVPGHPPFGSGIALSTALGVMLFSLLFLGLGQLAWLREPWPWVLFGLGGLLALPGLALTWRDHRDLGRGLERGFGPRWLSVPAGFLLAAALVLSLVWITGAFGWGGRGFLFERAGLDWAVGATFFDPAIPRDPFLGNEPLSLWAFGLGAPAAALALSWWLGVAILFGVCGLGWRLHAHGAGLLGATLLAIVLFATDRPLFLAPALPATLALVAVMILAVESRGRPHLARTLVAGGLGGFALISDLGAAAMLVPLALFGPSWCKKGEGFGRAEDGYPDDAFFDEDDEGYGDEGDDEGDLEYAGEDKLDGVKKWLVPTRHLAIGFAGLSLPLAPWALRNDAWTGDLAYGFGHDFQLSADYRFRDFDRDEPGFQPSFERVGEWGAAPRDDASERFGRWRPRLEVDPRFLDYVSRIGTDEGPDHRSPVVDGYLDATEWGLGIGAFALISPLYGRRRRDSWFYVAPAALGYGLGSWLGAGETTHPSALALLSVSAGSTLYGWRECAPRPRTVALGGTALAAGLSVGLSGASDCGYWDEFDDYEYYPRIELRYEYAVPETQAEEKPKAEDEGFGYTVRMDYRWHEPGFALDYRYQPEPEAPAKDETEWKLEPRLGYDYGKGLDLQYRYEDEGQETEEGEAQPGVPSVPQEGPGLAPPAYQEGPKVKPAPDSDVEPPRQRPTLPTYRPKLPRNNY